MDEKPTKKTKKFFEESYFSYFFEIFLAPLFAF